MTCAARTCCPEVLFAGTGIACSTWCALVIVITVDAQTQIIAASVVLPPRSTRFVDEGSLAVVHGVCVAEAVCAVWQFLFKSLVHHV